MVEDQYHYLFKFIMIGDSSVGKSSVLLQFTERRFPDKFEPTIGVEFGAGKINLNDIDIRLKIWDTAGQECFRSITRSYYRGSIGAILMYDITNKDSFNNIQRWISDAKNYGNEKMILVLVGNKSDLNEKREISQQQGQDLAEQNGIKYFESSAKTGENVKEIFYSLSEQILNSIENNLIDPMKEGYGIQLGSLSKNYKDVKLQQLSNEVQPQKSSSCCNQ